MEQLVFVEKEQVVTDSLTVANVFGKEHKNVKRDIENQIVKLIEAGEREFSLLNFERINYLDNRSRTQEKFLLSEEAFTLVAFAYITPEAMKMKVKFIQEFKRMREHLTGPRVLSEKEQLMASMRLSIETAEEIATVKEDVIEMKSEMKVVRTLVDTQITLQSGEQRRVQKAVGHKIYEIETDPQHRSRLFRELHREVKDRFGVASYKDLQRNELQAAIGYIDAWVPRKK